MSWKVVSVMAEMPGAPRRYGDILARHGIAFEVKPASTTEEMVSLCGEADAIIGVSPPYTRKLFESLPKLRHVAVPVVGFDTVDVAAATEHGVIVSNNPDYCMNEVSDHAMALLLALARRIVPVNEITRAGKGGMAAARPHMVGVHKLWGQTLGLVGFGRISRLMARKAQGFGMRVITHDPYITRDVPLSSEVDWVDFDELLAQSDFISLHANLTPENRGLFGREQFAKMKKGAYLINTARGGLVDEAALYEALKSGHLGGAGLDVTDPEPPRTDNPLLSLPNAIFTSHTAVQSVEAMRDIGIHAAEEIVRVYQGLWPLGLVNPAVQGKYLAKWGKK
ncbi:MAG: C-terminal binding protein [Chloroflexi bacterium]|nr:C-terminal binding protein [Chloroflexota bacterium]